MSLVSAIDNTVKKNMKFGGHGKKRDFRAEKNSGEAKRILSEIKGLKVIPLNRLKKGAHYQLRIKSELKDRNYPISGTPWEFETDWYTINFIY